jgi:hypothetical protein
LRNHQVLLPRLDLSRGVEGAIVTNSPLDFRQFSFTHIIQVLGLLLWYTASQLAPLPTCYCPVPDFSFRLVG